MIRFLALIPFVVILAACGDTDNAEPPAELVDFEPALEITREWSVSTGDGVEQQFLKLFPLMLDESVVVTDRNGTVSSYTLDTGKLIWETVLDMPVSGGVGGDHKHHVITGQNGHVVVLDASGKLIWKVDASSEVLMPAAISANLVIIRSVDGRITALDLKDGSQKWTYKRDVPALSLRGNSTPLIKQGYIFAGLDNGRLVVLDLLDGHTVFDIPVATPSGRSELERIIDIDGDAIIRDDALYMASYQSKVVSINIKRGQLNWSRKLSSYSGIEYTPGALFISDERDHIWSLEPANGATLWKQDKLSARKITRPVSMLNTIVVADFEGYLHWLSAFDGHFMAREHTSDSGIIVPPILHKGKLYTITRDGELFCFSVKKRQ